MNLAVGVDLVEVGRIARALERHPERFLTRHYTARERAECGRNPERLAARWCAKEAGVKALGTGIGPVGWHDIETICDERGNPVLYLHGAARLRAAAAGLARWSVSISHTAEHAVAVVAAVGPTRDIM